MTTKTIVCHPCTRFAVVSEAGIVIFVGCIEDAAEVAAQRDLPMIPEERKGGGVWTVGDAT